MNASDLGLAAILMREAADILQDAQKLLLEPSSANVDLSSRAFSRAAEKLGALKAVLQTAGDPPAELMAFAIRLRTEFETAAQYLDSAAAYHANLFRAMTLASGSPPPPPAGTANETARHVQLSA